MIYLGWIGRLSLVHQRGDEVGKLCNAAQSYRSVLVCAVPISLPHPVSSKLRCNLTSPLSKSCKCSAAHLQTLTSRVNTGCQSRDKVKTNKGGHCENCYHVLVSGSLVRRVAIVYLDCLDSPILPSLPLYSWDLGALYSTATYRLW